MEDNMNPEESPSYGVKRANNLPLYVAAALGVLVVGAIIYGGLKRFDDSEKKRVEKKTKVEKPVDAKSTIDNLLSSYEKNKKEKSKEVNAATDKKQEAEPLKEHKQTPEEKRAEQIRNKKMQDLMEAIGSGTSVKAGDWVSVKKESKSGKTLEVADRKVTDWDLHNEVEAPRSPYMLRAGHVIPAVMIQGINSDLPGKITAQVSENIYDTATHTHLLIPQGTKLFGEYDSEVDFGQERIMEAWNRLTFPDGKVLDIGDMPGTDAAGYSGFQDKVNHHYVRIYGNALLMSAVLGGVALTQNQGQGSNQNGNGQNSNSILSQSLGQTMGQATTSLLQKNINIKPTIEVGPGYQFNVMIVKDITFKGEYQSFDY